MRDVLDLDRYPLDRPESPEWRALVARCRAELAAEGLADLPGFLRPGAPGALVADLLPRLASGGFRHARRHNIYFRADLPLPAGHPALTEGETSSLTLCADRMGDSPLIRLYEWPPFAAFLAAATDRAGLHPMADPLARVNVMAYGPGEGLDWHFDRSEFTTTLLLQAPEAGGMFEYRRDLRTPGDPNYEGVARLLRGEDPELRRVSAAPGTLTLFRGRDTAHRVTPVAGGRARLVAVFAFFERAGVTFSAEERLGFYGRAA